MPPGRVIFLNGTSSSGKTVIAKALQQILDEIYLHVSVDTFVSMIPERYISSEEEALSPEEQAALATLVPRLVSGMHRCIATLASAGLNLIVDHVFQAPEWLSECVGLLADDFPVLFVGVRCPLEELERRERKREREPGTARKQLDLVHAHGVYDVEVDSSILTPTECAIQISAALQEEHWPGAFAQLKRALGPVD